jgi:hypothetical protein
LSKQANKISQVTKEWSIDNQEIRERKVNIYNTTHTLTDFLDTRTSALF